MYKVKQKIDLIISVLFMIILIYIFEFEWKYVIPLVLSLKLIYISVIRMLIKENRDKPRMSQVLSFQLVSLGSLFGIIALIEVGTYVYKISYLSWIFKGIIYQEGYNWFHLATIVLACYISSVAINVAAIWEKIRKAVDIYLPPIWILIIAIWLTFWIGSDLGHRGRQISILVTVGTLVLSTLCHYGEIHNFSLKSFIRARSYIITAAIFGIFILTIGLNIPDIKGLPGEKLVKKLINEIGGSSSILDEIPYELRLSKEIPLSDEVLFTIKSSEPLYLREAAYEWYENNTWSIPKADNSYTSFITFKPVYLEAEYVQLTNLIDEMAYIRQFSPSAFKEYEDIFKYESSITIEKSFFVGQNPSKAYEFFTANGLKNIVTDEQSSIYYYYGLDNIFFHGKEVIEPANYRVDYYDRVPKEGTREYALLKKLTASKWMSLYEAVDEFKEEYDYDSVPKPKVLQTYTPMRQYDRIEAHFLQIPSDIENPIRTLAGKVVNGIDNDWDKAIAIENYLKGSGQYTYSLNAKAVPDEEDSVYDFLFKQKQGICQDFASSMVLMCRSIGLPARYVTGYKVTEKKDDYYEVRVKDAHAFVEVYFAGYGWLEFDPTPSQNENIKRGELTGDVDKRELIIVILLLVILISLIGISYKLESRFAEVFFLSYINMLPPEKSIKSMVKHMHRILKRRNLERKDEETLVQYAKRLAEKSIDVGDIFKIYERYQYGFRRISIEEKKLLKKQYKNFTKNVRFL